MKKILVSLFILSILSCNSNQKQILTDKEWGDILSQTLVLCPKDRCFIYNRYGNSDMKDIVKYTYLTWAEKLYYTKNDTLLSNLMNRINKPILNKLDTICGLGFINDTNNFKDCYIVYSEPFYTDSNKLCISLSQKRTEKNLTNKWVCLFENQEGSFRMIEFYNYNEDSFYSLIK